MAGLFLQKVAKSHLPVLIQLPFHPADLFVAGCFWRDFLLDVAPQVTHFSPVVSQLGLSLFPLLLDATKVRLKLPCISQVWSLNK